MASPVSFALTLIRRCPPWLQRTLGLPFIGGLGDPIDVLRDKTAEAVDARFPRAIRPDALPYIGRDRKIVRGYNEPAETYAVRLKRWLLDHRTRGNAYSMLRQLEAYFATAPVQLELVFNSGTRYTLDPTTLDADGLGTITRDAITWGGNGIPGKWAEQWLFIRYDLVGTLPLVTGDLANSVKAICDDWSAAHMLRTHSMIVWPDACRLIGYPEWEIGDGTVLGGSSGDCYMFDDFADPVFFLFEDGDFLLTEAGDYVVEG